MGPWNDKKKKIDSAKSPKNNKYNHFFSRPLGQQAAPAYIVFHESAPWTEVFTQLTAGCLKKMIHVTQVGHGYMLHLCTLILAYISFTNTYIYFPYFTCFE